jgi:hypothetical protein
VRLPGILRTLDVVDFRTTPHTPYPTPRTTPSPHSLIHALPFPVPLHENALPTLLAAQAEALYCKRWTLAALP